MRTDFLFAMPSFWSGVARNIDLFGLFTEYNESTDGAVADARALYSDWRVVADDLAGAMMTFDRESQEEQDQEAAAASKELAHA